MTGKEYMQTQMAIVEVGKRIHALPLEQFLKVLENAAPAITLMDDSLMSKRGRANIAALKELALQLQLVKEKAIALQEVVTGTSVAYLLQKEKS